MRGSYNGTDYVFPYEVVRFDTGEIEGAFAFAYVAVDLQQYLEYDQGVACFLRFNPD